MGILRILSVYIAGFFGLTYLCTPNEAIQLKDRLSSIEAEQLPHMDHKTISHGSNRKVTNIPRKYLNHKSRLSGVNGNAKISSYRHLNRGRLNGMTRNAKKLKQKYLDRKAKLATQRKPRNGSRKYVLRRLINKEGISESPKNFPQRYLQKTTLDDINRKSKQVTHSYSQQFNGRNSTRKHLRELDEEDLKDQSVINFFKLHITEPTKTRVPIVARITRRTTTRPTPRVPTTPLRISFDNDCDNIGYFCMRAYKTGPICARTLFYTYKTFRSYCEMDYVNCMTAFDMWEITYMGECRRPFVPLANHHFTIEYYDERYLFNEYVDPYNA